MIWNEVKIGLIRLLCERNVYRGKRCGPARGYQGARREDAYATVKRILNIPRLEPHVYTEQEYDAMRGVLSKIIASGIVIEP